MLPDSLWYRRIKSEPVTTSDTDVLTRVKGAGAYLAPNIGPYRRKRLKIAQPDKDWPILKRITNPLIRTSPRTGVGQIAHNRIGQSFVRSLVRNLAKCISFRGISGGFAL